MVTRRELLAGTLLAPPLLAKTLFAKTRIDKTRIGAITDEIAYTPEDALAFAKQYNLRFVEVRNVPTPKGVKGKGEYAFLPEAELKEAAASFAANGLKVSFMNTGLLKYAWPDSGYTPRRPESEEAKAKRLASELKRWERRKEDVEQAVNAAVILGCDKLRVFTGSRVADPKTMYARIAETMKELEPIAAKKKIHLLIENEGSQNIGTSQELADIMALLPSKWIGYNWDPQNALVLKEVPWPNGYAVLPKKRMLNIQFKGKGIMAASPEKLDWAAIVEALNKDGYQYQIGMETHLFDGTLIAAAHESMETMLRIVG
jgi:sugar phosphate isomerase/epimerase